MTHRAKTTLVVGLVLLSIPIPWGSRAASAAVVPIAWYKLGEDDPGATAGTGNGQNPTQDSTANNFDLARHAAPGYSSDTATLSKASTLSMDFSGSAEYYDRVAPVTTVTSNVGIEAWAKPDAAAAPAIAGYVAYNGSAGSNGYGIFQAGTGLNAAVPALSDNHWYALLGGIGTAIDMGVVTAGQWVHLGLTIDALGNASAYRDGALVATVAQTVVTPTAIFQIGGYAPIPQQYFDGKIDQVRVFTFTGAFDSNDFLIGPAPEPGSAALLLMACGSALAQRRRCAGHRT